MGELDVARVDVAALLGVARQYETAADIIDAAARRHLAGVAFDGAAAGLVHAARGDAVRSAVEEVAYRLRQWSRAAREIAAALRASADRYAVADVHAARRVG